MLFQKVTLAGVGLLGGSLGLALRQRNLAGRVTGLVRRAASIAECQQLGVVDTATRDPSEAVADADLVVLCTPIASMRALLEPMLPGLKPGAIVTDVGSVKGSVVREFEPIVAAAGGHFIGSHPMAGAERTGPAAAHADLFSQAVCVITPTPRSSSVALSKVERLWRGLGSNPVQLNPEVHDELVSRSSHLPHVIASELANYVLSPLHPPEQSLLCASGFRDTTRIASSSPEMWRDIVLANRDNLGRVLGVFIESLEEFQHALDTHDARSLERFFTQAKQRRDAWSGLHASASPE
jgi:prephenate dehydrogenase